MKKILLSISLFGFSFFSQSQVLLDENFDGLTLGNLGTDVSMANPGQGGWYTYVNTGGANSNFQIIDAGSSDYELQLTGPTGATSSSTTRYAIQYLDWANRTAGNDVLFGEFTIKTGAAGITSTNDFRVAIYDATFTKMLVAVTYNPKTKLIRGLAYANGGSGLGNYLIDLNNGTAVPALTANSEITIQIAFDKLTGYVYWAGTGAGANFSYAIAGAAAGVDPSEVDVFVRGGTSNTASTTCVFDDFYINAQPCVDPALTSRDAAVTMEYLNNSLCKDLTSVLPTLTPNSVGGTFYSSTSVNYVGQTTPGESSTGEINPSNSTAGTYIITYYTAGSVTSCSYITKDTITIKNLPAVPTVVASGSTALCSNESVILSTVEALNTTYAWSNAIANDSITVSALGNYTVTATSNGCASTSLATEITSKPSEDVAFSYSSNTLCLGGPNAAATKNDANVLGIFSANSNNLSINSTTGEIDLSLSTPGTYVVKFVSNGSLTACADSSEQTVTVTASPNASFIFGNSNYCASGNMVAPSFAPGASAGVFTSDLPGLTINSSMGIISPASSTPGNYVVTNTINVSGCPIVSETFNITINALPTATITPATSTTFCQGGSVVLNASTGVSYLWSNSATTSSITASNGGNYTVTVTDANGCSATSSATTVTVNSLPTATITPATSTTFCQGGSVVLNASNGATYLWSNGATTASITANTADNYSVTVTNANGCSATSSATVVTVNANPTAPTITPSGNTTFCQGGNVTLTSSTGNTYLWSNNATTNAITVTSGGNYTVTISNANGCTATSTVTAVTVNSLPSATITPNGSLSLCDGESVTLVASTGTTYLWSNNATTSTIDVTNAGTFTVAVTNGNGCTATSSPITVTVGTAPATPTISYDGSVLTATSGTSYQWYLNGTPVVGAVNQTLTPTNNGNYTVVISNGGCPSAPSNVYNVTNASIEALTNNSFVVYPNPANDKVKVAFNTLNEKVTVSLVDIFGKVVFSQVVNNQTEAHFDFTTQARGSYFITIVNENGASKEKLILQ